jgi:hypothetical protein
MAASRLFKNMNFMIYNINLIIGMIAIAVGAGLVWGLGAGLIAFGTTLITLTITSAFLVRGR